VFSGAVSAVEYVTLNINNQSIDTDPTDLIECVGISTRLNRVYVQGVLDGKEQDLVETNSSSDFDSPRKFVGCKLTGLSQLRLNFPSADNGYKIGYVTYKITKASEINKVGPTSVLILPENATGNYDLIVESSSDSVTWTPFHSQAVQSDTVKRLFRVRIVHNGQEEAKAKAEEK